MKPETKDELAKALQKAFDNAENAVEKAKIYNAAYFLGITLTPDYQDAEGEFYINSIIGL